jgi:hypothetical protein
MGGILSATLGYKKWALYGQYQTGIMNVSRTYGGQNSSFLLGIAFKIK